MSATYCEYGTCKRRPKVCVSMLDMTTRETRKTYVCRDHLRDVLSACERSSQQANIHVLETPTATA